MLAFVPVFFFASEYAQIALGKSAQQAGLVPPVLLPRLRRHRPRSAGASSTGAAPSARSWSAARWPPWASPCGRARSPSSTSPSQIWYVILAGAGMGFMLDAGQHRRRQPGVAALLRRGHRHHPDGPELRGQPGARHPRHDPGDRAALPAHHVAHRPGRAPAAAADREAATLAQSPKAGEAAASRRSRTSSGSTSPTPPDPCFYVMCGDHGRCRRRRVHRPRGRTTAGPDRGRGGDDGRDVGLNPGAAGHDRSSSGEP